MGMMYYVLSTVILAKFVDVIIPMDLDIIALVGMCIGTIQTVHFGMTPYIAQQDIAIVQQMDMLITVPRTVASLIQ